MSYLYIHREHLDGSKHLAEIAYAVTRSLPPDDRDDVEQRIVIALIQTTGKDKSRSEGYLWTVARYELADYWTKIYKKREGSCHIGENDNGEIAEAAWRYLSNSGNIDARLDAESILASLPARLIEIDHKKLNGEALSKADQSYLSKKRDKLRPKLNRPQGAGFISLEEAQGDNTAQ